MRLWGTLCPGAGDTRAIDVIFKPVGELTTNVPGNEWLYLLKVVCFPYETRS